MTGRDDATARAADDGPRIQVGNEFTTVRVRKVLTRNGERLEVHSPKLGTTILLDPLELESLTWQTTETFSRMLEDPYGPEDVQPRALSELMADREEVSFDDRAHGPGGTG